MEVSQALLPLLARNLCRPRHPLARNLCRPRPRACPYHPWGRPTTAAHAGQNAESCPNASTMRKKYNTEPVASLRPRAESDEKKLQPSRMCAIAIIYQKSKAGLWRRCPCHLDAKRRGRAAMPGAAPGHAGFGRGRRCTCRQPCCSWQRRSFRVFPPWARPIWFPRLCRRATRRFTRAPSGRATARLPRALTGGARRWRPSAAPPA